MKLIKQILQEVSIESGKHSFIVMVNELFDTLRQANEVAERQIAENGDLKTAKRLAKSKEARWFSQNHGKIISMASTLKSLGPAFKEIAGITVTAYKSDAGMSDLTKSAGFKKLVSNLPSALKLIGRSDMVTELKHLQNERDRVLIGMTKQGYYSPASAREIAPPKPNNELKGHQSQQAEKVVNDMILTLPKTLQHQARQTVSKAGNKVLALMQFMKQHGLD